MIKGYLCKIVNICAGFRNCRDYFYLWTRNFFCTGKFLLSTEKIPTQNWEISKRLLIFVQNSPEKRENMHEDTQNYR